MKKILKITLSLIFVFSMTNSFSQKNKKDKQKAGHQNTFFKHFKPSFLTGCNVNDRLYNSKDCLIVRCCIFIHIMQYKLDSCIRHQE